MAIKDDTLPQSDPELKEATPGENFKAWFDDFLNLRIGSDRAGAVASIVNGKQMRGSNAWMLVCSILIASLGLNLNSGAVIIGAMLISPLMNPILGIGLAVGTNDWPMLWQALKNFGISMVIALTASTLYFVLTPIHNFTPEMQGRTEPTILDALVAVFGGLAGIISVTREDKTNAIPGVAIATALMPPLCVSGYGIALAWSDPELGFLVFWRSFYLFFINSFFIAVTAYIIIRLLRFPYRKYLNKAEARRSLFIVLAISILMILPSVYILRDVLKRQKEEVAAREFTERYFPSSASTYNLERDEQKHPLLIYPIKDRMMSSDSINYYTEILRAPPYNLENARIVTDTAFTRANLQSRQAIVSYEQRLADLEFRQQALTREVTKAAELPDEFTDSTAFARMEQQVKIAFPTVQTIALSKARVSNDSLPFGELPLAVLDIVRPGKTPEPAVMERERQQLSRYFASALRRDSVIVVIWNR
ncbi:DUF389 domain-containing protein [Neolewinella antarctica]|uniref:Hydrophobic protein (TIGR00271 family) n=1 Tax=Neolewinella antarctica TaxID=442734 RepID=A0ABX0XAG7_9BACT|nr:DUF389 domain-containing protein [Neolewinella antarctica]NJC26217.1 putative hydrophobic protein (TIGR00271 family) [Neolewinella antarctica]